jgi:hypothetical protein
MWDENIYAAANYTLAIIMCRNGTVQETLRSYLSVNRQSVCAVVVCVAVALGA